MLQIYDGKRWHPKINIYQTLRDITAGWFAKCSSVSPSASRLDAKACIFFPSLSTLVVLYGEKSYKDHHERWHVSKLFFIKTVHSTVKGTCPNLKYQGLTVPKKGGEKYLVKKQVANIGKF